MKQDIRDLFKEEDKHFKSLPSNHRVEFKKKLQKQFKPSKVSWLRVAALFLIALTAGAGVYFSLPQKETELPIVAQIKTVEAEYLEHIENEWNNFISLTDDKILVARYQKKLNELDKDYQDISSQFTKNPNDLLTIEALIDNLKTRLKLLKDIQQHIHILNTKITKNESTI